MFCFGISSTQQLTSWADTSLRLLQLKSSMTAITNCDKHEVVAEWPIGLRRRFGGNLHWSQPEFESQYWKTFLFSSKIWRIEWCKSSKLEKGLYNWLVLKELDFVNPVTSYNQSECIVSQWSFTINSKNSKTHVPHTSQKIKYQLYMCWGPVP